MLQTFFSFFFCFCSFSICWAEAVVNKTAEEVVVIDVSTGKQKEHVKKPTLKRAAQSPGNAPKLKKMKKVIVDASDDAIYKQ